MDLEKQQEYSDYVRGEATNAMSPLTLTSGGTGGGAGIREDHGATCFAGRQWAQLRKNTARTAEQEKQYPAIYRCSSSGKHRVGRLLLPALCPVWKE